MTIDEVIANLNRTIIGKIKLMDSFDPNHPIQQFILINIGELERIRSDVMKVKETLEKA